MNFLSYVPPSAYDSMLKSTTPPEPVETNPSSVASSSDTSFGSRAAIEQQLTRQDFELFVISLLVATGSVRERCLVSINLKAYLSNEVELYPHPGPQGPSSKETQKEQNSKLKSPKPTKKTINRGSPYSVAPVKEEVLASRVLKKLANLGIFSIFCSVNLISESKILKNEKTKMN